MNTATKPRPISLDDLKEPQEIVSQSSPNPEPQVEPQIESVVQPEVQPATEQVMPPSQETVTAPVVDDTEKLAFFNKLLNQEFTSTDQIVERFNAPSMTKEYEELKAQHEDLKSKFDILVEQTDPASIFSSEDVMKLEMWKKENPKKDSSVAQKIFATADLNQVNDLEIVKMAWRFDNPLLSGTEKDLEEAIAEELRVDADLPLAEWPKSAQIRLSSLAGGYRSKFDAIKQGVKLPERFDVEAVRAEKQQKAEARKAELSNTWKQHATTTANSMKSLKVPVGTPKAGESQQFFEWDLKAVPTDKVEAMVQSYVNMGVDYTDTTKNLFDRAVRNVLLEEHIPHILQKYGDDLLARQKEEFLRETHNTNPLTDSVRPTEGGAEAKLRERSGFASGATRSSIFSNPLFKLKNE